MKRPSPLCLLRRLYCSGGRTPSPSQEPWPLRSLPYHRLSPPPTAQQQVALFWDLDNFKPPSDLPTYDAAVRLKLAAASFGTLRYTFAFANPQSLRTHPHHHTQPEHVTHLCRVCGRKFRSDLNLVHHFKQVHEREQEKRVRRLESARGTRRGRLAGAMSAKMHKYRTAARDLLERPTMGCRVGDEIRRAGFAVRLVAGKPEAADAALRRGVVGLVERRVAGCVVLVSDDLGFAGVVGMARERGVWTVLVGDDAGGGLRRCADSGFLWREVVSGKARKEVGVVVGRWKNREVLKRLECTYRPERGEEVGDEVGDTSSEMEEGVGQWWELDSDEDRLHRLENLNVIGED